MELARDICAFANANGGVVVYGIREVDDRARTVTPVPLGKELDATLRSLRNTIVPTVPAYAVYVYATLRSLDHLSVLVEQQQIGSG